MKPLNILILSTAALIANNLSYAAPQHAADAHPRGMHQKRPDPDKMFERADTNGDGNLDAAESKTAAENRARRLFDKADADKDGSLSLEEFTDLRGPKHARMPQLDREELDTCLGDAAAELPERTDPQSHFTDADSNQDGNLSAQEFVLAATHRAERMFERHDSNADGVIDSEERAARRAQGKDMHEAMRRCMGKQRRTEG